jgi:hypothetical protein
VTIFRKLNDYYMKQNLEEMNMKNASYSLPIPTPCQLSATAYSICSQLEALSSISNMRT